MIRQLSETVILPIAGLVLTFIATYELIQLIADKNSLHDVDTWIFFKWIFKTFMAVMILSNAINIVMAVFDVAQSVVQNSAGLILGSTAISPDMLNNLETELLDKKLWSIPGRIKDKAAFEENINNSLREYNLDYWRARSRGRETISLRPPTPAKQMER